MSDVDVLVIGSGPSGLAAAGACAAHGLRTAVVGPDPRAAWRRNFGLWADELAGLPEADAISHTWASPLVRIDPWTDHHVNRRYARLDVARLQAGMLSRVEAAGVRLLDDRAERIVHDHRGSVVALAARGAKRARVVIDASGPHTTFLARSGPGEAAYQTAFGRLVEVRKHPWPRGEMVFMDWSLSGTGSAHGRPTFLYAMPLDYTHVFVEETSLVARPGLSMDELSGRLDDRLRRMGLDVVRVLEEERCSIPMGLPLPRLDQRVVGFGAAASMVHPASGYLLARVLRQAPELAQAVSSGLSAGGPREASSRAWGAIWSKDAVRNRELYRFGMDTLCDLDLDRTRALFDTFFRLPDEGWRGFLSDAQDPAQLTRTMLQVFNRAEPALRRPMVSAGLGMRSVSLLRSVVGW